ncbi:MAG: histidine phosphatase family protein [Anaerolineae bacterium]|nr:histidine phosphatase family protein [Anaerolineae bacterium]
MDLYLIRHGQSVNNAIGTEDQEKFERLRHHDPALTEIGQAQAARLGAYLAASAANGSGITFDRLYTSAMHRALQTTRAVAEALERTPQVWLDIHETGGMYSMESDGQVRGSTGITRARFAADFPGWAPPDEITEAGWWDPSRGEETLEDSITRAQRVAGVLYRVAEETPEIRLALVSHGAFLDRLIRALLGLPMPTPEKRRLLYAHNNTGLSKISFTQRWGTLVEYLNRVDHLSPDLHTW